MADHLKCSVCGKDATVHLTQIVNNKIHKVDLCEECAQQKGVTDPEGFSLADLLAKTTLAPARGRGALLRCEVCGLTAADFKRTGRMGCPACYEALAPLVKPVLEEMHAGTKHLGKVPERALSRHAVRIKVGRLQDALDRAVAEEEYELAARYRDEIREIEESGVSAEEVEAR